MIYYRVAYSNQLSPERVIKKEEKATSRDTENKYTVTVVTCVTFWKIIASFVNEKRVTLNLIH